MEVGADSGRCKRETGASSGIAAGWGCASEDGESRAFARSTTGVLGVVGTGLFVDSLLVSCERVMLGTQHCAAGSPDCSGQGVSGREKRLDKSRKKNEMDERVR